MRRRAAWVMAVGVATLFGAAAPAMATDRDRDGYAAEQGDCDDWDPFIHPGQTDRPDLAYEDTDCDKIDGTKTRAVFVSVAGGDDSLTGVFGFPKHTLAAGIAAAAAQGKDVYVAAGTYAESVTVPSGVSIYGGYALDFLSRTRSELTTIDGSPQAILVDAGTRVGLQLLTLRGRADEAGSAYGLRAINGSSVALEQVSASAGNARNAAPALAPPPVPDRTASGSPGANGVTYSGLATVPGSPGAAGGAGPYDPLLGIARNGGSGGNGAGWIYDPPSDGGGCAAAPCASAGGAFSRAFSAALPDGPTAALTGAAAAGESSGGGAVGAGSGGRGADGAVGGPGSSGASLPMSLIAGDAWRSASAASGTNGRPGAGGAGGGGGAPQTAEINGPGIHQVLLTVGAGGGGGGAGGNGGHGGSGGNAGGGSFGVFLSQSRLVAVDSTLRGGEGGNGSPGLAGTVGGAGGPGGAGGAGSEIPLHGFTGYGYAGGAGGDGGPGGTGGAGGGGSGGPSAGVYRSGMSSSYTSRASVESGSIPGAGAPSGDGATRGEGGTSDPVIAVPGAGAAAGDFDEDSVPDDSDPCPALTSAAGCPPRPGRVLDGDGDGVVDLDDSCPSVAAGTRDANGDGCADDVDGDGVIDEHDACASTAAGSHDADGDGCPDPVATATPTPEPTATPTPEPTATPTPEPTATPTAEPVPFPGPRASSDAPAPSAGALIPTAPTGTVTVTLPSGEVKALGELRSIPIGSVVDARKGQLLLSAPRASVRVRAGMFQVRKRQSSGAEIALVTAAGADAACKRPGPAKGVVRSLQVQAKGQVRVVAGAAVLTPSGTTDWTVRDRCDGTQIKVTKGRLLATATKGAKRTRTIRAGSTYLVKARLFAART